MNLLTSQRSVLKRLRAGFSLTEVVVALGLVVSTAIPMIGALSMGFKDANSAVTKRNLEIVRTTLRTRLQSPEWPAANTVTNWQATRWFDAFGKETESDRVASSAIEVRMTGSPGIGFQSDSLESVKVEFLAIPSRQPLGETVIQRVK
jgi:uncharacterized protein (TIGR02598 family)